MKVWKWAALAVAVCACVTVRTTHQDKTLTTAFSEARAVLARATGAAQVQVPADLSIESPGPFAMDAALARKAVRDGVLHVVLPDGREQRIAIERQYTDETGYWTLVGRAASRIGAQAMVLTFGGNAVFGRIPMPDGSALHVFTAPGGRVVVAPDGGIVPKGFARVIGRTDVVMPEREHVPQLPQLPQARKPSATASKPVRLTPSTPTAVATATTPRTASAPIDTTPVTVDVITIYSPEQVTLRGSDAAVQTEIASLFAISNQAHIDSGSRVRLRSVHVRQLAMSRTDANPTVLQNTAFSPTVDGVSLEALRDQYGGDLVSVLRPYHDTDATCGVAYTPGSPYMRTSVYAPYGYGVINVDGPCGTLVHAHEIGHNLGSMHDRETDTDVAGTTMHGAYVFSSGHRTKAFATVMAYRDGSLEQQWIGRFSNPAKTDCVGAPCGIADISDNVRSLNLMAPAIAAFRGTPNQLAIPDLEVLEPNYADKYISVPVRLSGAAPAAGVQVAIQDMGGTATVGADYDPIQTMVTIPAGEREGYFVINVRADQIAEGDETIALRISAMDATPVSDADAVITISESDTRLAMTGRIWFPPGLAPTTSVPLTIESVDGPGTTVAMSLSPPNFDYSVNVPKGMQVSLSAVLPDPLVAAPAMVNEVRDARAVQLFAEKGVRVTGRMRATAGMTLPEGPIWISTVQVTGNGTRVAYSNLELSGPDYAFSILAPPNANVGFDWYGPYDVPGNPAPFSPYTATYMHLQADKTVDIVLSDLPTLVPPPDVHIAPPYMVDTRSAIWAAINLEGNAPAGGVTFRYRTVDGTAKAGQDYTPISGTLTIPAGSTAGVYLPELTIGAQTGHEGPEYFYLVLDQVTGAQLPRGTARIVIDSDLVRTGGPLKPKRN